MATPMLTGTGRAPRAGAPAPRRAARRSVTTQPSGHLAPAQDREMPTVPSHVFPTRPPAQLLVLARKGLDEAVAQRVDGLRYAAAHVAGLRAAAAVVAARSRPVPGRRSKLTSVWDLLSYVAPELAEWATYFAASAGKRAAAEAGIPRVVNADEADDLVRAAAAFIAVVELALGLQEPGLLDDLVA